MDRKFVRETIETIGLALVICLFALAVYYLFPAWR